MAESLVDPSIMSHALSSMVQGFTADSDRRQNRFTQLSADSAAMWAVALTSPTLNAALGARAATESGAGRTRAETNEPYATGAARPAGA